MIIQLGIAIPNLLTPSADCPMYSVDSQSQRQRLIRVNRVWLPLLWIGLSIAQIKEET